MASPGDPRVWWVPPVPQIVIAPFVFPVRSISAGSLVVRVLADYDQFQLKHGVKPDFCNAGGLEVFEGGEWCEWRGEDGSDILELIRDGENGNR